MDRHIEQLVNLLDPNANRIVNMSAAEATATLLDNAVAGVEKIRGSFALVARRGKTVLLARSMDRPVRYFLAKQEAGPALIVADRIDAIAAWLKQAGLGEQFHPSYTRMVPAHYVVAIELVGCPDPDPTYTRFFTPQREALPADLNQIGRAYVGAAADTIAAWLSSLPADAPIGVAFSGGVDSGAVLLLTYHLLRTLGMNPARLKAFTLDFGGGADLDQARQFLDQLGLGLFLEPIEADPADLDVTEAIRVVEDYKPLDVQSAAMTLALCRGIRLRYPDWKYLLDGEGGDENLKDYPIHENPELTIRSVLNNLMLYQEGWGVGKIKHSLTYSGGLSRSYTRTYASTRRWAFEGFSPFTQPTVVAAAEGIPFTALTGYDEQRLYDLKGEIVARGVRAITGLEMPVNPKRRFQHGTAPEPVWRQKLAASEAALRAQFLALYA